VSAFGLPIILARAPQATPVVRRKYKHSLNII
jgi:hypothetical protein